jgi:hypothetical protein
MSMHQEQDWRIGAAYFEHPSDYDVHSNYGLDVQRCGERSQKPNV